MEELLKENIYSFMKTSSAADHTPLMTFEGSGDYLDINYSDLLPLVFLINGERVETLWGYDNGEWKILKIDVIWDDSLFQNVEKSESILSKTVKFTSGFDIDDALETFETEPWILEIGLFLSFFENLGLQIDFGFNNIVDEENIFLKSYEFEIKTRARLEQSIYVESRNLNLTAYITGGVGFKAHLSNIIGENLVQNADSYLEESYSIGVKDYYSFPTIFSLGFEYTNNNLIPNLVAGIEFTYEYELPYYSFFKPVEEDEDFKYATFIPEIYFKWVY